MNDVKVFITKENDREMNLFYNPIKSCKKEFSRSPNKQKIIFRCSFHFGLFYEFGFFKFYFSLIVSCISHWDFIRNTVASGGTFYFYFILYRKIIYFHGHMYLYFDNVFFGKIVFKNHGQFLII